MRALLELDEAIGLLQQIVEVDPHPVPSPQPSPTSTPRQGTWDEIVDLAAGTTNEDDVTLQVRLLQARGFIEQGMREAAMEACEDCLRSKKRDSRDLLTEARYERALLYAHTQERRRRPAMGWRSSTPRTRVSATCETA